MYVCMYMYISIHRIDKAMIEDRRDRTALVRRSKLRVYATDLFILFIHLAYSQTACAHAHSYQDLDLVVVDLGMSVRVHMCVFVCARSRSRSRSRSRYIYYSNIS